MPHRHPPVVIIGAGVGGLTLALLLRQRGIAAEVLEQSAELHEVGAAVGLAANATRVLPHQGQGANQTIEDAVVLAEELASTGDVLAALGRYARRRRVRTRQVQLMSWAASDVLHLPDGPAAQRRNASLPRLADRLAWIHAYDAFALA